MIPPISPKFFFVQTTSKNKLTNISWAANFNYAHDIDRKFKLGIKIDSGSNVWESPLSHIWNQNWSNTNYISWITGECKCVTLSWNPLVESNGESLLLTAHGIRHHRGDEMTPLIFMCLWKDRKDHIGAVRQLTSFNLF